MDVKKQKTWVRVAGNGGNIKKSHPHGWRCYIEGNSTEIPLKNWFVIGKAERANFIPGVKSTGDNHGLVAWIDCFGSYTIEDGVLHIELQPPTTPPLA